MKSNSFKNPSVAKQKGFTLWSFLFVAGVVILAMYIGAKLVPVYTVDSAIKAALNDAVEKTSLQNLRKNQLIKDINQKLYIDGVYEPPAFEEVLNIKKTREGTTVSVDYREDVPLFLNIGLYLDFSHSVEK